MKELEWQPVPGTRDVQVFPITRKPDVVCSNTYLLKTGARLAIVDPGGLNDHLDRIKKVISETFTDKPEKTLILLTHCHVDHSMNAVNDRDLAERWNPAIAAQEYGANGLEQMDEKATLADLLNRDISPGKVDIKLFCEEDLRTGGERNVNAGNGEHISITTDRIPTPDGRIIYRQALPFGSEDRLTLYYTPGHSIDGICIRAGDVLLMGDLFFGANPMISGSYGWDQKAFIESLKNVEWLITSLNIQYCLPGHGRIIDAKAALKVIRDTMEAAKELDHIDRITPEKVQYLRDYSADLLDEAGEIFSIIVARMYYVSYRLESLGEDGEAGKYMELIDSDRIDGFLEEFARYADEFKAGNASDVQFVLKAFQIVQKIDTVFESDMVEHVVDKPLLRKAKRLLNDFLMTIRGYDFQESAEEVDLNELVEGVIRQLKTPPPPEDLLESADAEDEFLHELIARIAYQPIFEDIGIKFEKGMELPPLHLIRERFSDAISDVLEDFACLDAQEIEVSTGKGKDFVYVKMSARGNDAYPALPAKKISLHNRRFGAFGGSFKRRMGGDKSVYSIEVPVAK